MWCCGYIQNIQTMILMFLTRKFEICWFECVSFCSPFAFFDFVFSFVARKRRLNLVESIEKLDEAFEPCVY